MNNNLEDIQVILVMIFLFFLQLYYYTYRMILYFKNDYKKVNKEY